MFKEGSDATVIACGVMVQEALRAAELLAASGLSVGVVNMSTVKPIDKDAIVAAARGSGAIVTAEEHSVIGGLGGAVAEVLAELCPVPMKRVGIKDQFGTSGKPTELMRHYGLTAGDIEAAVREAVSRKAGVSA